MGIYILKKLLQLPVVLLFIIVISFFMMRWAPGGPFTAEKGIDKEIMAAMEKKYNLDKPLHIQLGMYLWELVTDFDLGPSFKHKSRTVNEIIAEHLPTTLYLGSIALVLSLLFGIWAGVLSAMKHNSMMDYSSMSVAMIGLSVPTFVLGPLLQLLFAMYLDALPAARYEGPWNIHYLILPSITLAFPYAARIARLMRTGMLEVIHLDFIRTAKSKGLSETAVVFGHALRGGILPVISFLGPAVASILTGSLVIEKVFQIPGLGKEFVDSALNRDYTLVMGTVIVYALILMVCNILADIIYGILDPRVRYE